MKEEEEEEELNQKALLEQVFGQSSSSDEDNEGDGRSDSDSECGESEWKSIEEVKGLWLCNNFLSPNQQSQLLSAIEAENWFTEPSVNQAMRFGHQNLPYWAIKLSRSIHCCSLQLQPSINLLQREPLFDQMIVNVYQPNEGICAHVDLLRFDDGIAIVSLESSCVMHFSPDSDFDSVSVPVLLTPGSLVLMFGDARGSKSGHRATIKGTWSRSSNRASLQFLGLLFCFPNHGKTHRHRQASSLVFTFCNWDHYYNNSKLWDIILFIPARTTGT